MTDWTTTIAVLPADTTELNFSGQQGGDQLAVAVSEACHLEKLEQLDLRDNEISDAGAMALAPADHLGSAHTVDLSYNSITGIGASALVDSALFDNIAILNLSVNEIGDSGFESLLSGSNLSHLRSLLIHRNQIGIDGIAALGAATHMVGLRVLGLGGNPIGDTGVRMLADTLHLGRLEGLYLKNTGLSDQGALILAQSSTFSELTALSLAFNSISDEGAKIILSNLRALQYVDFRGCELSAPRSLWRDIDGLRRYYAVSSAADLTPDPIRQVLLLGEPRAGKTTLFKRLRREPVVLQQESRTQGLNRGYYPVNGIHNKGLDEPLDMLIDIWDLGGHIFQQMGHTLFYRADALYVLVIGEQTQESTLRQLLDHLEEQCAKQSSSRIFVLPVWNARSREAQPDLHCITTDPRYRKRFLFKELVSVDLSTDDVEAGLASFELRLREYLIDSPVRQVWSVIDDIELLIDDLRQGSSEPRQTFEQTLKATPKFQLHYASICTDLKERGEAPPTMTHFVRLVLEILDQRRVITLVNDLGLVIHDPLWVEKGFYALLPPEDDPEYQTTTHREFVQRMRSPSGPFQLPGVFQQQDIECYLEEIGIESSDHWPLLQVLARRELGLVMTLKQPSAQNLLYCVPAYLETVSTSTPSSVEAIQDAFKRTRYCEVFERDHWPPYFPYRHMVWIASGDRTSLSPKPEAATHLELCENSLGPGRYQLKAFDDSDYALEIIEDGKRLWIFWQAPDEHRPFRQAFDELHASYIDLLAHLTRPSRAIIPRYLPCPLCIEGASDTFSSVGLIDAQTVYGSPDNEALRCTHAQPHQLPAKVIQTYYRSQKQTNTGTEHEEQSFLIEHSLTDIRNSVVAVSVFLHDTGRAKATGNISGSPPLPITKARVLQSEHTMIDRGTWTTLCEGTSHYQVPKLDTLTMHLAKRFEDVRKLSGLTIKQSNKMSIEFAREVLVRAAIALCNDPASMDTMLPTPPHSRRSKARMSSTILPETFNQLRAFLTEHHP